jgi:multicomponent Na+:H+ antiporter subunit A
VAGAVEHETGTRDVSVLSGLRRGMPVTALAAGVAAGSMAGIPLFGGFIAKEQLYDSIRASPFPGAGGEFLIATAVAASICLGSAGLIAGFAPFRGRAQPTPASDEALASLWFGPLVLGGASVILGLFPSEISGGFPRVTPAADKMRMSASRVTSPARESAQ